MTGHSYIVYGPLSNGATCFMHEGAPNFPDWGRFWRLIEKHRISTLYTAPTAIRAFMRQGDEIPKKSDLSSLRLLGTVGEPINPEAWLWYHRVVGDHRCPIVDTWWQTETGSVMLTTLPGACYSKPGSTGLPFFGCAISVVKADGTPCAANEGGKLVIEKPWPSMARTLYKDDERFKSAYWSQLPGRFAGEQRDAYNLMFGFAHAFRFSQDRHLIRFGYQWDNESSAGAAFAYTGHRSQAGVQTTLPMGGLIARNDYDIHFRDYKNIQPNFTDFAGQLSARVDTQQTHSAQLIYPITDHWSVSAQYQRVQNKSNIPLYDYVQNIWTGLVTWTY